MSGPRPERIVVVVGTGTEVGKTWVGAHLLRDLRAAGSTVAARKPVQSFDPGDTTTDAHVLGEASGEPATTVCPTARWYEIAMAPPMAAEQLGRPAFTVGQLVEELDWPTHSTEVGLVETAGGVRSPMASDGDGVALTEALDPDVIVVVADAGLGTINSVRLTMEALDSSMQVAREIVVLNRFDGTDPLHQLNRAWLADRDGFAVATSPSELARLVGLR